MNNQAIFKYQTYKKLFVQTNHPVLDLFENLLYDSSDFFLECSHKISNIQVFSCRLNIWYPTSPSHSIKDNVDKVLSFIWNVASLKNVKINDTMLNTLLSIVNLNEYAQVVAGIDLRDNFADSRVKFYLGVNNQPKVIKKCLELCANGRTVREMINDKPFGFGFGIDFYLNNRTQLKIYSDYFRKDIENPVFRYWLRKKVSEKAMELVYMCKAINISLQNNNIVIGFRPIAPDKFVNKIGHSIVNSINEQYKDRGYTLRVIALLDRELAQNNLTKVNLYY